VTDVDINRMLRCTKCGEWKPDEEFYRNRAAPARRYRTYCCSICSKARVKEWASRNRERKAEYNKQWFAANPEYHKRYYAENRERRAESSRRSGARIGESGLARKRELELWRAYRLDPREYVRMCDQGCHRCETPEPSGGRGTFDVDHDHSCCEGRKSCGECVRGVLCNRCNNEVCSIEKMRKIPGAVIPDAYLDRWEREGQWWKDQA